MPQKSKEILLDALKGEKDTDKIQRLVELISVEEEREAQKSFNTAFMALREDIPAFVKTATGQVGNREFQYITFDSLMETLVPLFKKHGFSVRFESSIENNLMTMACHFQHIDGHKETFKHTSEQQESKHGMSATQSSSATATVCKRYVITNSLGIIADTDTDAQTKALPVKEVEATPEPPAKSKAKPKPMKNNSGDNKAFRALAKAIMATKSTEDLENLYRGHLKFIKKLQETNEPLHSRVINGFAQQKDKINNEYPITALD